MTLASRTVLALCYDTCISYSTGTVLWHLHLVQYYHCVMTLASRTVLALCYDTCISYSTGTQKNMRISNISGFLESWWKLSAVYVKISMRVSFILSGCDVIKIKIILSSIVNNYEKYKLLMYHIVYTVHVYVCKCFITVFGLFCCVCRHWWLWARVHTAGQWAQPTRCADSTSFQHWLSAAPGQDGEDQLHQQGGQDAGWLSHSQVGEYCWLHNN